MGFVQQSRLYSKKGTIAVGSDADLALWDPKQKRKITNRDLHHGADYTPYEGMQITGWPTIVILHGQIAVQDGTQKLALGSGTYLQRPVGGRQM